MTTTDWWQPAATPPVLASPTVLGSGADAVQAQRAASVTADAFFDPATIRAIEVGAEAIQRTLPDALQGVVSELYIKYYRDLAVLVLASQGDAVQPLYDSVAASPTDFLTSFVEQMFLVVEEQTKDMLGLVAAAGMWLAAVGGCIQGQIQFSVDELLGQDGEAIVDALVMQADCRDAEELFRTIVGGVKALDTLFTSVGDVVDSVLEDPKLVADAMIAVLDIWLELVSSVGTDAELYGRFIAATGTPQAAGEIMGCVAGVIVFEALMLVLSEVRYTRLAVEALNNLALVGAFTGHPLSLRVRVGAAPRGVAEAEEAVSALRRGTYGPLLEEIIERVKTRLSEKGKRLSARLSLPKLQALRGAIPEELRSARKLKTLGPLFERAFAAMEGSMGPYGEVRQAAKGYNEGTNAVRLLELLEATSTSRARRRELEILMANDVHGTEVFEAAHVLDERFFTHFKSDFAKIGITRPEDMTAILVAASDHNRSLARIAERMELEPGLIKEFEAMNFASLTQRSNRSIVFAGKVPSTAAPDALIVGPNTTFREFIQRSQRVWQEAGMLERHPHLREYFEDLLVKFP